MFSYAFIFRVLQFLRRLGLVLTLPAVLAITQVGTDSFSLPALASLIFLAAGFTRAMLILFLLLFLVFLVEVVGGFVSVARLTTELEACQFAPTV